MLQERAPVRGGAHDRSGGSVCKIRVTGRLRARPVAHPASVRGLHRATPWWPAINSLLSEPGAASRALHDYKIRRQIAGRATKLLADPNARVNPSSLVPVPVRSAV